MEKTKIKTKRYVITKGGDLYCSTPSLKEANQKLNALVSYNKTMNLQETIELTSEVKTITTLKTIVTNEMEVEDYEL